jgi:hypothetical protein
MAKTIGAEHSAALLTTTSFHFGFFVITANLPIPKDQPRS